MNNKLKILIAFPFVFTIILFVIAGYVPFKAGFTETEGRILAFTPSDLAIKDRQAVLLSREITIPIDFSAADKGEKPVKPGDLVQGIDYNDSNLSLIVVSGNRKMAIIRGALVREGDSIEGMKIARIEPDRVLLKNKTERWIYLGKEK
jgi:hypothetical protein